METCDVYLRKSLADDRRSVKRQLADLSASAEPMGLAIGQVFADPDLSASRFATKARPDFAALVAHIRSGACAVLGLAEPSRGSRTLTEWSQLLDLCRSMKVRVWVQTHGRIYDLSRARDWRTLAEDGIDAAYESERLSERLLSGQRQAAMAGRPHGRPYFGWVRHYDGAGKLTEVTPHPEQAPVVAEIVARLARGDAIYAIARDLDARGVPTPRTAGKWNGPSVRELAKRPANIGQRAHHGQIVADAMWPPIVDAEVWHDAMRVLSRPDRRSTTRGSALRHWLSGAIRCGLCDAPCGYGSRGNRDSYYCTGCTRVSGSADIIEALVEAAVIARLRRPDVRALFRPPSGPSTALRRAEAAADLIRAEVRRNEDDYRAGTISARLAGLREAELAEQLRQVEAEVDRLTMPPEVADLAGVDIPAVWHDLTPVQRRAVVRRLAVLVLDPSPVRGSPVFYLSRLDRSRWTNDARTWGELARHPLE